MCTSNKTTGTDTIRISAEADNFRDAVLIAIEAAIQARKGEPSPAVAAMARKITAALDAV
ncbi:hypothetical protein [Nocardia xishanensis]